MFWYVDPVQVRFLPIPTITYGCFQFSGWSASSWNYAKLSSRRSIT